MATILQVSSSPRLKGRLWITPVALRRRRLGVVLAVVPPLVGFVVGWWESPHVALPTALAALTGDLDVTGTDGPGPDAGPDRDESQDSDDDQRDPHQTAQKSLATA